VSAPSGGDGGARGRGGAPSGMDSPGIPLLFPAIDLLAGRAVRLHKGARESAKVYSDDPPAQARRFVEQGARIVHVVDLDAAFGERRQLGLIERIAQAAAPVPVQVGGGIRDLAAARETLALGATRVILGTAAVERPRLAGEAVAAFGADRVAVGIDVKDGRAAVRGWTEATGPSAGELAAALSREGVRWLVVTAVARDGTLGGFDISILREVAAAAPGARIVASGGAGTLDHLRALAGLPGLAGAIAGTALYEGRFGIAEGQAALATRAFQASGDARAGQLHTFRAEDEDAAAQELFPRKEPGAC
jgi:phosphoribosylformimino-5-aminoimidazole carboxamide ribotide isomerase